MHALQVLIFSTFLTIAIPAGDLFAEDEIDILVEVSGEVLNPGLLSMRSDCTLLDALTRSGGFTDLADTEMIYILRRELGGDIRQIRPHFHGRLIGRCQECTIPLCSGDIVVVPKRGSNKSPDPTTARVAVGRSVVLQSNPMFHSLAVAAQL